MHSLREIQSGEADLDEDGEITAQELFEYLFQQWRTGLVAVKPYMSAFNAQGRIILARRPLPRLKLFLSHAWEDKEELVRPLANELRKEFDVFYDEYSLKLGDSLFDKISKGLHSCNYGVVVLSPHFIAKKWPASEISGLFALETKERKIILPIWHKLDRAGVESFSPILADRVAVHSSVGVALIVDRIRDTVRGKSKE